MAKTLSYILFVLTIALNASVYPAQWYPKPFRERRLGWGQHPTLLRTDAYVKPFPRPQFHAYIPSSAAQSIPEVSSPQSTPEVATPPPVAVNVNMQLDGSGGQQTIVDHGDTFLTISLEIGKQQIHAIPDSGSFELYIVDGDDCDLQLCRPAYKPDSSSNHFTPQKPLKKDIYFGSGTCGVELSFDSVRVHNEHNSPAQSSATKSSTDPLVPLWRIVEMDENLAAVWGDGQGFQGIVGLGFKGNSHKDSRETLLEEQVMVEAREKTPQGVDLTKPGFASKALFGDIFAICLPRGEDAKPVEVLAEGARQDDGRLWWGKNFVPNLNWVDSPVIGTRHWTIAIESSFLQQDASKHDSEVLHTICGGPGHTESPCAALVDSGTSLIAMSEVKIRKLLATTIIGSLNPDCSNVDEMPDLVFNLGRNQKIVLTPDTYVMKIRATDIAPMLNQDPAGRVVLENGKKVLNIQPPPKTLVSLKSSHRADSITYCTHAFMETPMETVMVQGKEHELIILGIPVFREYSVKFDRNKEVLGFAEHPFGTTCHDLVRSDGKPVTTSSSFASTGDVKRHLKIRSLGSLRDLVFPDEFASI